VCVYFATFVFVASKTSFVCSELSRPHLTQCNATQHNAVYVELRTTPRAAHGFSKRQQLTTILNTLATIEAEDVAANGGNSNGGNGGVGNSNDGVGGDNGGKGVFPRTIVRLLLSVDRSRDVAEAADTVEIAAELLQTPLGKKYIVGFDFSGLPSARPFVDFVEVFTRVRDELRLKVGSVTLFLSIISLLVFATKHSISPFVPTLPGYCALWREFERRGHAFDFAIQARPRWSLRLSQYVARLPYLTSRHITRLSIRKRHIRFLWNAKLTSVLP
jgi:hypothetical protein